MTTKHGKGSVIVPALAAVPIDVLQVNCDTDLLGTFTGEVERPGPPRDTAVRKARLGMQRSGCDLGLASEGTFGPHPAMPWLTLDQELVVLVDDTVGSIVTGRAASISTRTVSALVAPDTDLDTVLDRADLPRHAVIVRPNLGAVQPVRKGLRSPREVAAAVATCAAASEDGCARVETDLRADRCPSRLDIIGAAARDLAERLARTCPACGSAGWGPEEKVPGLPCAWCGAPTAEPQAVRVACPVCAHQEERRLVAAGAAADPGRCIACNP